MNDKIKINLTGTAETMLQSFYARALYSKKKGAKFYDGETLSCSETVFRIFLFSEGYAEDNNI